MKAIGCIALHYGKEYLAWAIRALEAGGVAETWVFYTPRPSFGHGTPLTCPDTESELMAAARRFARKPVIWNTGLYQNEGDHRNRFDYAAQMAGADMIVWNDADEIWDPETLRESIDVFSGRSERTCRVRFLHLWKSWFWSCEDACMPVRLIRPSAPPDAGEWYLAPQARPVYHFGYAQSDEVIEYKQSCHGHKNEWRQDWFATKWKNWAPGITDVHPTCELDFWKPRPTSPEHLAKIEELLHDHPARTVEI